ncbi:ATP-binding protein [Domibacillus robiginosus]|uniref:ATP-binding protein n=1 Tax=Domibacillus robiginosus TaxID=1071054 RepID=UPI00067AD284|nr:ATP-binding protein [Domibacillus robiginosus]
MSLSNDLVYPKVALTKNMELISGAHILYLYAEREMYWENILSFAATGLELQHQVVLLESAERIEKIKQQLARKGFSDEQIASIGLIDHRQFYDVHQSFETEKVLQELNASLQHYVARGAPIRIWSRVIWNEDTCCNKEIPLYEQKADAVLKPFHVFTVCAYDGNEVAANFSLQLMKGHSHIMTDNEIKSSPYYENKQKTPSLFMEDFLQEKVQHYKHVINEMPDAVFIFSGEKVVYGNYAALNMLKCKESDLRQATVWEIFAEVSHPIIQQNTEKLLRNGRVPLEEMQIKTYDGQILDVEVAAFPFSYDLQNDFTVILIIRSIQDRKAHQQLTIKTEKLSLAGQLAASIAHEVRNPLTSIKGFIKLAREDVMHEAYYTIIEEEIDRIETIASELLVLGKPMSVEMETCDAGKMLKDVSMLLQSQAVMRKVDIQYSEIEANCFIRCNAGQMKQVFINIIKNAIEAMENGGVIRTSAHLNGDKVEIIIKDEGKGMPESVLKKLGEPFYSTKEDGTGLGLMVCFNIVEQYEGTIRVESKVGEGTIFTIELPLFLS